MPFISITEDDRKKMLQAAGLTSVDQLFTDIPESIRKSYSCNIPAAMTEMETEELMRALASQNRAHSSFLGAGSYRHYVPAAVDFLASRSEFFTAYTPYQPEVSQGTLTAIFEFQSMISSLTGMDVTNASMYDGATALAESVLMVTGAERKPKVLVSSAIHPHYRDVLETYAWASSSSVEYVDISGGATEPASVENMIDDDTAALVVQSPNFFGCIEDLGKIATLTKQKNIRLIVVINEMASLGLLRGPGEYGADVVCGEAQSFGNYTGFGGPMLGFISAGKEFTRKLPGRLVGKTVDSEGKEAYVLTLQTREQHIRREKATSNICTNEGLLALRAVIYLSMLGPRIYELAALNHARMRRLRDGLTALGFEQVFDRPFFNEVVLYRKGMKDLLERLKEKGIVPGYNLSGQGMDDCLLVCATEMHTDESVGNFLRECSTLI